MKTAHIDYLVPAVNAQPTAKNVKDIFTMFLMRDGFTLDDAVAEFDFINGKDETTYLTASRIGLKAIGGRAARRAVFASYENALNHAAFA
jgi:hypothetical protein